MANCRACGGVLGRDCYNESDCMDISRNQDMYMSQDISNMEHYVSILIYTMEQKGISVPNSFAAESPLIFKLQNGCENRWPEESYLPF